MPPQNISPNMPPEKSGWFGSVTSDACHPDLVMENIHKLIHESGYILDSPITLSSENSSASYVYPARWKIFGMIGVPDDE
ncbi:MAG: hypothetical protein COA84_15240 [Robiginitomaculum sp.]|nr:MAG: hypothetical protein COA84_15240 [Robiginitomaculum sp.]